LVSIPRSGLTEDFGDPLAVNAIDLDMPEVARKETKVATPVADRVRSARTMRAVVQGVYGGPDRLRLSEVEAPALAADSVLVRMHASSVNMADRLIMRGMPYIMRVVGGSLGFGVRGPKPAVRGTDVAGTVEAVGDGVSRLRVGDEVYGESAGSFAELLRAPEGVLGLKPSNLTFEEAAAMPVAAITALQGIRDHARAAPGRHVLVNGASGGVGHFAVQIAKALGAEVTGVASTRNVAMVRSLGADHVIDYSVADFTDAGPRYDAILDLVGNLAPARIRRALRPNGVLVLSYVGPNRWVGPLARIMSAKLTSRFQDEKVVAFTAITNSEDLAALKALAEAGQLAPVIDRTFALSEATEAISYLESGRHRGKVVISI
jgi:NADPH:quinone reductase-like Zn-dependent oxidoreductase